MKQSSFLNVRGARLAPITGCQMQHSASHLIQKFFFFIFIVYYLLTPTLGDHSIDPHFGWPLYWPPFWVTLPPDCFPHQCYRSTRPKGPNQFWWSDATPTPSYSYKEWGAGLAPHLGGLFCALCILQLWRCVCVCLCVCMCVCVHQDCSPQPILVCTGVRQTFTEPQLRVRKVLACVPFTVLMKWKNNNYTIIIWNKWIINEIPWNLARVHTCLPLHD